MKYWKVRNVAGARLVPAETVLEAIEGSRLADVTGAELHTGRLSHADRLLIDWQAQAEPGALDYIDAAVLLDIPTRAADKALHALHDAGQVHIVDWLRPTDRGRPRPLFELGLGEDAPRPAMSAEQLRLRRNKHSQARRDRIRRERQERGELIDYAPEARDELRFGGIELNWKAPTK